LSEVAAGKSGGSIARLAFDFVVFISSEASMLSSPPMQN
jgi:hypothetical protein